MPKGAKLCFFMNSVKNFIDIIDTANATAPESANIGMTDGGSATERSTV